MPERHVDVRAVLADLKDFQRRTAVWTFERMFDETDCSLRFLVADEVGLGKTHVAKGVIAQVIDHLQRSGDERHDIVYVCSNGAIARQNLRKLVPRGIEPLEDVERLTMLPLATLNRGGGGRSGVNLLAITPGTSLKFGRSTGRFEERCLAYTFLRALWGADAMRPARARWIFWQGVSPEDGDDRLRWHADRYLPRIQTSLEDFAHQMSEADRVRKVHGYSPLRTVFDDLVDGLRWKRTFPDALWDARRELIGEVRRIMAIVGISALRPDLVVLDEFQRFKDLLTPDPTNFAAELAHRLFDYEDPDSGRSTRTLLLSATPYRMYTTADETDGDHYADFLSTCSFLLRDEARVRRLRDRFDALRAALTASGSLEAAEALCSDIAADLRRVMARTERLAATPDRDGMLAEQDVGVAVTAEDLRSYRRFGDIAEAVEHHEPTEYWKSGPYLLNFMESYRLKQAFDRAAGEGLLPENEKLAPGPGLLDWHAVEAYEEIDPQNGRLRWLLDDLERHRAFELLWIPASMRYYDAESVYETEAAQRFTKRLIFSGWALVPKVVSSLVSFEAERRAFTDRSHRYTAEYRRRGGQRLTFRTEDRTGAELRPGEARSTRRAAAMTAFLLVWPSVTLAELGDPRPRGRDARPFATELLSAIEARVAAALAPLTAGAPASGPVDRRWYWAAPLFLDRRRHPALIELLLAPDAAGYWEGDAPAEGFVAHLAEARAMVAYGLSALGRVPDDLSRVLAEVALGGPAPCALRALSATTGLPVDHEATVAGAAWVASRFRAFFNAPEVTGTVVGRRPAATEPEDTARYWRDVVQHAIDGNLQAVLDEHAHILRDWLGHVDLADEDHRVEATDDIAARLADAVDARTSTFRVDVPRRPREGGAVQREEHRMRTRFAVAFGNRALEEGGEARGESVSIAFNSPFWPFVLTSTSVGQEGLDFHLWCHAVVHWNLPANPVDLEQREGRVHRYKCHAVRRNIAAALGAAVLADGLPPGADAWDALFARAAATASANLGGEIVPYWVFHEGPAKIERHVPVLPFSRESVNLPRLRKALAAYRLAFGQPRQDELLEFLGATHSDEELLRLAARLRIDLTPPTIAEATTR
jgi:Helicase conserved C-terminal domain